MRHAQSLGVVPGLWVGDFESRPRRSLSPPGRRSSASPIPLPRTKPTGRLPLRSRPSAGRILSCLPAHSAGAQRPCADASPARRLPGRAGLWPIKLHVGRGGGLATAAGPPRHRSSERQPLLHSPALPRFRASPSTMRAIRCEGLSAALFGLVAHHFQCGGRSDPPSASATGRAILIARPYDLSGA